MDHHFVARAMCKVTEELLWLPRREWALKREPTASLLIRVGSGKKTYLSHKRDISRGADMKLTYGVLMIADKCDPNRMGQWLSAREVKDRGYYGGELTLLNVLAHTICHEFGHFVQVILGRSYSGSVHNDEFYTILDRIHGGGEGDKIRAALHDRCMQLNIDLRRIIAHDSDQRVQSYTGDPNARALTMRDVRKGQLLQFLKPPRPGLGAVRVFEKRRTKIVVELVADSTKKWIGPPAIFSVAPQ